MLTCVTEMFSMRFHLAVVICKYFAKIDYLTIRFFAKIVTELVCKFFSHKFLLMLVKKRHVLINVSDLRVSQYMF